MGKEREREKEPDRVNRIDHIRHIIQIPLIQHPLKPSNGFDWLPINN